MIIDTHCHLDFKDFDPDRREVIERARKAGIGYLIDVASSVDGTKRSLELSREFEEVYSSVGIHPHDAGSATGETMAWIEEEARSGKVVAIGEVGLDYYRNLSPREGQVAAFRKFIALSYKVGLPLIIHSRDAGREVLDILKEEAKGRPLRGVMHCFSGDAAFLKECIEMGLFISFTCNLTFRNAKLLREVAKEAPVERLLLETDAPFLAPEGFRGGRNEPAYMVRLVEELARLKGLSADDIARITTHNASLLFGLGPAGGAKIAYPIRDSLYLNITNRCTNDCDFCVRRTGEFVKGHRLKLPKEPDIGAVLGELKDAGEYREVVFCGYGEPTARLDLVKAVSKDLKERGIRVRLVTNGHGDLINSRSIARELKGLVDKVSVSLNVDSEEEYDRVCHPTFGPGAYRAILQFARDCVESGIATEVTCLDLPGADPEKCRAIAEGLGASFRQRSLGAVG